MTNDQEETIREEPEEVIEEVPVEVRDMVSIFNKMIQPTSQHKELHKDYGISNIRPEQMPRLWYALLFYKQLAMLNNELKENEKSGEDIDEALNFFSFVPDMVVETMPSERAMRAKLFVTTINKLMKSEIDKKKKRRLLGW